jgi:hypothetical protein
VRSLGRFQKNFVIGVSAEKCNVSKKGTWIGLKLVITVTDNRIRSKEQMQHHFRGKEGRIDVRIASGRLRAKGSVYQHVGDRQLRMPHRGQSFVAHSYTEAFITSVRRYRIDDNLNGGIALNGNNATVKKGATSVLCEWGVRPLDKATRLCRGLTPLLLSLCGCESLKLPNELSELLQGGDTSR